MNYPVWDIPLLGGGMLIGIVAILHTFVSQFAIGGGLFLVLTERKAYRENDTKIIDYLKIHSKFFILLTLVFGAVSGVAIWFTIGLVSPVGTSSLIHIFVWAWAIEWVFFFIEIAAAMIYYYGWDKLDQKTHIAVGWIYFISAWMSLFVINGILSFMLTPGGWIITKNFWDAFLNPTMLPSAVLRTAVTIALAGLYALVTASFLKDENLREKMIKYSAKWIMGPFIILPVGALWFASVIPELSLDIISGGAAIITMFVGVTFLFSGLIFIFAYFLPFKQPKSFPFALSFLFLFLGLMVIGGGEMVREAIRKPFLIYNYLYSNNVFKSDVDKFKSAGVLQAAKWTEIKSIDETDPLKIGKDVFKFQCQSCHTIEGYNGIKPLVKNWDEEYLDDQLEQLNMLKGFMPPFMGSEIEQKALAKWLYELNSVKGAGK